LDLITEIIIKLLKTLKEDRIILAGYSFGGIIALQFYREYFNKIDHFIIIHSSYYFKKSLYKKIIFKIFEIMLKKYYYFTINYIAIPILKDFYFKKKQIKDARYTAMKNDKKSVIKMFDIVINKNMIDVLNIINCQTLIIGSYIDILVSANTSKKINKIIKNSKLKILKLYGHYSIMSKPEELAMIIDNFIKS
jgi:pimeloyl-ACP methyl ester carboxylesterase